ncbi:nitrate reductase cytochrome c-type subunit [Polaribacter cellanae]|uniref:Nitrate reductase cytochrome c-type subunit n=1 Tax=Polaribacter cellanae TaxID=2818493 RepID=A0A975CKL8_9FLAO|nr:nitrate reductase cytochrome c-type subunit [Polaribacter cellanae]QTE21413.1 nitrate reductase cytochrome c-type subunit [Polaribacter cellanae]
MKKRLGIISLFIILFIAFIVVWNFSYQTGQEEAYIPIEDNSTIKVIPSEAGTFRRSEYALDYANMPVDKNHQRTLDTYYNNRSYHGAPPSIPHPVKEEMLIGENTCLQCHENGGFVQKFNAYAPVTPHPEMVNCRQCHVIEKTNETFKPFEFRKVKAPKVGVNNALVTSPPVMPHQLQMHENCLSCHAGPSAPKEIRVSHPERVNCRQCHVLNNKETTDIGIFIKKLKDEK